MSWFEPTDLTCPKCHHVFATPTARTVNVTRMPDARSWVMDGSFHVSRCPGCGETITVDRDFLYTDLGREQFALVQPTSQIGRWAHWEEVTLLAFQGATESGPAFVQDISRRFRIISAFGVRMLGEKLRLAEAGLDDALVELCKLDAISRDPALRAVPTLMVTVTAVSLGSSQLECDLWTLDDSRPPQTAALSLERYRELAAHRLQLESKFPTLFFRPFCCFRRLAHETTEVLL